MSYLVFDDFGRSRSGTTRVWIVTSTSGSELGTIRWHGAWRQYTFWPAQATIFNPDCLDEISTFVRERTSIHRTERRLARGR